MGILSLIPGFYGLKNALAGAAAFMPIEAVTPAIDSQFRFQSAVYFGLALMIWWILPNIEKHTTLFRIAIFALFLGGLSRLYSYFTIGEPPINMFAGMILELSLPLLIIWHNQIKES